MNFNSLRSVDILFIILMIGFSYLTRVFIDVVSNSSGTTTTNATTSAHQYSSGKHPSQVQHHHPPPQRQPSKSSSTMSTDSSSSSSYKVTFINRMMKDECDLYWVGNNVPHVVGADANNDSSDTKSSESSFVDGDVSGPKLYYGPIVANGGTRTIEGYAGQTFALLQAGTYQRLGTYTIQGIQKQELKHDDEDTTNEDHHQQFILTDQNKQSNIPPPAKESKVKQQLAAQCRLAATSSCEECMNTIGCGWSPVRHGCFLLHPIATFDTVEECYFASQLSSQHSTSITSLINQANDLLINDKDDGAGRSAISGPKSIRQAYLILEHVTKILDIEDTTGDVDQGNVLHVALSELTSKLGTVFDDQDAKELLESSRHEELAKIHPNNMPMVDRRTLKEAKYYISQGIPVVITDIFSHAKNINVVHKWTLEYLYRNVFSAVDDTGASAKAEARFNVATDVKGKCCRYFESESKSKTLGYPYPFTPTTHLYRDKFEGFVNTVRKKKTTTAEEEAGAAAAADRSNSESNNDALHYLHEIVMNSQGDAVVAGGPAPTQLKEDLESIVSKLQPIANDQPFFGGFASAKLWIGQKGIVMPLHYDATDNMYVMIWGRKRAIIGPPGQFDTLYRYPNNHPLVGSSQVNLTAPDVTKFPRFQQAQLQEVVVGPGDVLYLPAWWWHQFEQPFEDTAALNLWSRDRDQSPDPSSRDKRIREHSLYDHLERSAVHLLGNQTGIVLDALARGQNSKEILETLNYAAEQWQQWVTRMPGGHPKTERSSHELLIEFLETQLEVLRETQWEEWEPGMPWDTSHPAVLPRELTERCEPAPDASPFLSYCA